MLLGDAGGAEVIKVEPPGGEPVRRVWRGAGASGQDEPGPLSARPG